MSPPVTLPCLSVIDMDGVLAPPAVEPDLTRFLVLSQASTSQRQAPYELRVLAGVTHWVPTQAPGPLADAIHDRVTSGAEPVADRSSALDTGA